VRRSAPCSSASGRPRISITLLKELEYCPRQAWMKYNTNYTEPPTPSMMLAARVDYRAVASRLNLPEPICYERELCNEEYGVCGRPDIVAGERRRVVVEVKALDRPDGRIEHFKRQARYYAWLVQTTLGGVWKYALVVGEAVYSWDYTYWDTLDVEYSIERAIRLLTSSTPPEPLESGKCSYCYFSKICNRIPIRSGYSIITA